MKERLLTAREAADFLRVHLVTLYSWVSEGKVPSIKLGRKRLFDPAELERWLETQTVRERGPGPRLADRRRRKNAARPQGEQP